jgi:hypothetical protein
MPAGPKTMIAPKISKIVVTDLLRRETKAANKKLAKNSKNNDQAGGSIRH